MKKETSVKMAHSLAPEELAGFFKDIAAVLSGESSALENAEELSECLDDFGKLSLDIKNKEGRVSVKLKVEKMKPPKEEELDEDGRPKYKYLKKKMKKTFKAMGACLDENSLPGQDLVRSFFEQSDLMVSYPDKGEEFYGPYSRNVSELKEAFESKDFKRFATAFAEVNRLRKESHDKYK